MSVSTSGTRQWRTAFKIYFHDSLFSEIVNGAEYHSAIEQQRVSVPMVLQMQHVEAQSMMVA